MGRGIGKSLERKVRSKQCNYINFKIRNLRDEINKCFLSQVAFDHVDLSKQRYPKQHGPQFMNVNTSKHGLLGATSEAWNSGALVLILSFVCAPILCQIKQFPWNVFHSPNSCLNFVVIKLRISKKCTSNY